MSKLAKVISRMNEEQENEYMMKIGKGEIKLKEYETKINDKLKEASTEVFKYKTIIQRLTKQIEEYNNILNNAIGKMDVLSQLLIDEENERRIKKIEDNNKKQKE